MTYPMIGKKLLAVTRRLNLSSRKAPIYQGVGARDGHRYRACATSFIWCRSRSKAATRLPTSTISGNTEFTPS